MDIEESIFPQTKSKFSPNNFFVNNELNYFQCHIDQNEEKYNKISFVTQQCEETTLERIEKKIDLLNQEVAKRDDIIKQTNIILTAQEDSYQELLVKIEILRSLQKNNISYKRLSRYATMFFVFFTLSFLIRNLFDLIIVVPFWNNIGLLLSFGFWLMAKALKTNWKAEIDYKE